MNQAQGRVLLVGAGCQLLADLLAQLGFEVEQALAGAEALDRAHHWGPAVIVLDREQGLPMLRDLKEDDLTRSIPVVWHSPIPLEDEAIVAALDAGANDVLVPPLSEMILAARVRAQISLYHLQSELRHKVMRDELTGVFSRRYLFESMRQHVNQFSRPGPPVLCCLMVDVDHFKSVNDRLGHIEGDHILRRVAKTIFDITRKGDVVARFGGEEFVVMLPSTSPEGGHLVAEKLRRAIEVQGQVTISLGLSWYTSPASRSNCSDEEMMHLLLSRADGALYRAKREGRNRTCLQSDFNGSDRRRLARVEVTLPVTIDQQLSRQALVSAGGLSLYDSHPLQLGDSVAVAIQLSQGPVQAKGRVVWTYTVRDLDERCGVAFEAFDDDGLERLTQELGHRTRVFLR